MATYYVDNTNIIAGGDGLSPETAVCSEEQLSLLPGDSVLFKRGTLMRKHLVTVSGTPTAPISYGAYGEGDLPVFCGSMDFSKESDWTEVSPNIWATDFVEYEACNFIFDNGTSYGILRWNLEDLSSQGDFYDNCFGLSEKKTPMTPDHRIYLYSVGNPAKVYNSIECATVYNRLHTNNLPNINVENIRFLNYGMHCIAGDAVSENIKIRNCEFINVGGCVWNYERRIRFGNAVEFWNHANNIEITHCYFDNIYDSATTHQGSKECRQAQNMHIRDNLFLKVGMGAFELRDRVPTASSFSDNICLDAGEGFSKLGIEMPRNSEIWPQPMGHHLFMWRVDSEKEATFEVKNNVFGNAPYGAAIYSIINPECEKFIEFEANTYYTENPELIVRLHGKNYSDFDEYKVFEKNCTHGGFDAQKLISEWKQRG